MLPTNGAGASDDGPGGGGDDDGGDDNKREIIIDTDPNPCGGEDGGDGSDDVDDEGEDEDLKAALELSLHTPGDNYVDSSVAAASDNGAAVAIDIPGDGDREGGADAAAPYEFDVASFHRIMWDDVITTVNDKERWIYQDISTPPQTDGGEDCGETVAFTNEAAAVEATAKRSGMGGGGKKAPTTPLELLTESAGDDDAALPPDQYMAESSCDDGGGKDNAESKRSKRNPLPHELWGLTQKHGGPCGVLAAVQAEMIRLLLFGRRESRRGRTGGEDEGRGFFYPLSPSKEVGDEEGGEGSVSASPIAPSEVREALASALAIILARAALAPAVSGDPAVPSHSDGRGRARVRIVLPSAAQPSSSPAAAAAGPGEEMKDDVAEGKEEPSLLQKPHSGWIWEMINSAQFQSDAPPSQKPCGLKVHAVTATAPLSQDRPAASALFPSDAGATNNEDDEIDDSGTPESKRQKKKEVSFSGGDGAGAASSATAEDANLSETLALAHAVTDFLLGRSGPSKDPKKNAASGAETSGDAPLDYFQGPGGVMFLVMSLVESRGIKRVRSDMDDPNTTITSQFGHSSQELINLLLTGQCTSNVFDNTMTISGELTCRGVQRRPAVGYLSQLESLRYCEVGGYYKSPVFPIWVVGSTSHFSVLFGDERCLQESKSDLLLEKCRRAFKKVEGGGGENGFIPSSKLEEVVDELDLRGSVGGDHGVTVLQAYLEVSGAEIILWDDFWKSCSRLMTGSSLENIMRDEGPPLLITQFGEEGAPKPAASASEQQQAQSTLESDEELARRLAAEWGTSETTTTTVNQGATSDEDFARELQAQWDAELSGHTSGGNSTIDLTSQVANAGDVETLASVWPPSPMEAKADAEMDNEEMSEVTPVATDAVDRSKMQKFDFEKLGTSFPLYHYNGLRGGCLTPFRVTRLSPEEAVGASIALSREGFGGQQGPARSGGGDLGDVVRTKWPSCMLNWFGKDPPYID